MLFGIKRKGIKKERRNYDYEDNDESDDIGQILDNIEEINQPDPVIQRQEAAFKPRINVSLGYEDYHITSHKFVGKKRGNSVKVYDEDEFLNKDNYDKVDIGAMPEISVQKEYEYKHHEGTNFVINDMDFDNYSHSNLVGDGIHAVGVKYSIPGNQIDDMMMDDEPQYNNYIVEDIDNIDIQPEVEEEIDPDMGLQAKIEQIKQLKEKKRIMEPKDELYDQDYQEVKQTKSKELIEGNLNLTIDIYQYIHEHDVFQIKTADDEDSDKEMLEWELSKLKNGMSSHWTANQNFKKMNNSYKPNSLNELFRGVNTHVDINDIIGNVAADLHEKNNRLINMESKLQIYEQSVEDNSNDKVLLIYKIDKYITMYKALKKKYMGVKDEYKSNKGRANVQLDDYALSD
jgi:hypothetical protein